VLRSGGALVLGVDSCVLDASEMTASTIALFFQGTPAVGGGQGAVFGDGLRCASGAVVRLAAKTAVAGAARFPTGGIRR